MIFFNFIFSAVILTTPIGLNDQRSAIVSDIQDGIIISDYPTYYYHMSRDGNKMNYKDVNNEWQACQSPNEFNVMRISAFAELSNSKNAYRINFGDVNGLGYGLNDGIYFDSINSDCVGPGEYITLDLILYPYPNSPTLDVVYNKIRVSSVAESINVIAKWVLSIFYQ